MLDVYEVQINGYPATLQLSEEDAKERGLKKSDTVAAKRAAADEAAEAKAQSDRAKAKAEAEAKADAEAKAAAAPANKARTPATK